MDHSISDAIADADDRNDGNFDRVIELINQGAPVNNENEGWTPLLMAALFAPLEITRFLLERGADPNQVLAGGKSVFEKVCESELTDAEQVSLMLDYGANINRQGIQGTTPLMWAISADPSDRNQETIIMLIERGADIEQQDDFGETALMHAYREQAEAFIILLQYGANPIRAIERAINTNNGHVMDLIIHHGVVAAPTAAPQVPAAGGFGSNIRNFFTD